LEFHYFSSSASSARRTPPFTGKTAFAAALCASFDDRRNFQRPIHILASPNSFCKRFFQKNPEKPFFNAIPWERGSAAGHQRQ
jgi:hypothetical protein